MTTPSTDALRVWARQNGIEVADRGRLSPKVLEAWRAAHQPASKASPPQKEGATPRRNTRAPKGRPAKAPKATKTPATVPAAAQPSGRDDALLIIDLRDQVLILKDKVEALESALNARSERRLFRRRA
jgi:hypothetical protein